MTGANSECTRDASVISYTAHLFLGFLNRNYQNHNQKLSCIYNEEVHQIPITSPGPGHGIQANDIGSLLEQFLEYEQGSDGDTSSYPDSYFITPVASPGGSNEDVVLGRLMIVQEKLSQEVEKETPPGTPTLYPENEAENEALFNYDDKNNENTNENNSNDDNNNNSEDNTDNNNDDDNITKRNIDGLMRTVNGIHPKGSNVRMSDSPKWARFKKKKLTTEPPARRSVSGPSTPRSTSPTEQANNEEQKRREAKLIEALALKTPKEESKQKAPETKTDIARAKRNLNDATRKRKANDPIPSRLMPVVSKRQRSLEKKEKEKEKENIGNGQVIKSNTNDPRLKLTSNFNDPRLICNGYCDTSNVTQLMNTNLDKISAATVNEHDDTTVDDVGIVDMTIDHEALSGTIITNRLDINTEEEISSKSPEQLSTDQNIPDTEELVIDLNNIKQEPADIIDVTYSSIVEVDNSKDNFLKKDDASLVQVQPSKPEIQNPPYNIESPELVVSTDAPKSPVKPPKNYRRMNNMDVMDYTSSSDSEEEYGGVTIKRKRRKSKTIISPGRYRTQLRSRSRTRSRSPHDRAYSPESPIARSELYDSNRSSRTRSKYGNDSRASSIHNSDEENIDISNKLSELSNPVPYDIEHERKLQFLVGRTHSSNGGYMERRNIYAGGINQATSKQELIERFRRFGKIDKITLHFREKGDNYAFIVYDNPDHAMRAIEEGNDDQSYPRLELCFGGRRRFVGGSYVDFDGNNSYLEETEKKRNIRCESPENDFDRLLKMATSSIKKKREETPEWD